MSGGMFLRIGGLMGGAAGLGALEVLLTRRLGGPALRAAAALEVPRLYGLVVVNSAVSGLVVFFLGLKVGMSRKGFVEKAKKDGDEHAEERFSYPKMYAEGFSKLANDFNCVQRAHQQTLETYPQVLACSLLAGLKHPIVTSIGQVVWMIARLQWAKGYSSGDPAKRYDSKWSFHIWTSFLLQMSLAASTGVQIVLGW
mmetsp:Transcript_146556/g.408298  ORF Transcript_146556/g.408298 Transcript_146556/m.408298 type:complete len:198 (-) Transcript_146556:181-774(-)